MKIPHNYMMGPNIIAIEFTQNEEIGNLLWMSQQAQYASAIFIYMDVEERLYATDGDYGYMEIGKMNGSRSFPVAVCSRVSGCYHCLNPFTRQMIDMCFRRIANELEKKQGEIDTVFFVVGDLHNCLIDVRDHPFVGSDVVGYIMRKICKLSDKNMKLMMLRNRYTI